MTDVQQQSSLGQGATLQCSQCAAALAADQRYCLNCGTRQAPPRVAAAAPPAAAQPVVEQVTVTPEPRQSDFSPLAAVLGVALLGGMLLIGVLIGRGESDDTQRPVVQVEEASTTPAQAPPLADSAEPSQAPTDIVSEWPADTEGFTVRLASTPKDGATAEDVEGLQTDAESQGVSDVAVLDSDLYPSLNSGEWLVYSGVYTGRADAVKALAEIQPNYAEASVVEVSAEANDASVEAPVPDDASVEAPAPDKRDRVPSDGSTPDATSGGLAPPGTEGSSNQGGG